MQFARKAGKTLHYMSKCRVGHRNKCFHTQIRMVSWMSHWDCNKEVKNNEIDARFWSLVLRGWLMKNLMTQMRYILFSSIGASLSKDHETAINQEIKCDTTRFTQMRTSGGRRDTWPHFENSHWPSYRTASDLNMQVLQRVDWKF